MSRTLKVLPLALVLVATTVWAHSHTGTRTAFEFSRAYDTCDTEDLAFEGTTRLVYAWNDDEPASPTTPAYHGPTQRSTESVNLVGTNPDYPIVEDDLVQFDLRATEHTIPANTADTVYWCELYKIPDDKPYHVVQFDMSINPRNTINVHHALLFDCPQAEGSEGLAGICPSSVFALRAMGQNVENVFSPEISLCEGGNTVWGWAVGGSNNTLPPNIGFPVGQNSVRYVMLEMHYDMPNSEEVTDNSGIILRATPTLRPVEAGILTVGSIVSPNPAQQFLRIPPGEEAYKFDGWCPGDCLADSIAATPEGKIHLFSGLQHAHLAGSAMRTSHVRNGTELEPILVDDNYDFDYQQYLWFTTNPREILPGDDILVTCTYNTEDRTEDTVGGIQTHEEMCVAFYMYYPRMPSGMCSSGEFFNVTTGETQHARRCNSERAEFVDIPPPTITEAYVEPECTVDPTVAALLGGAPELLTDVSAEDVDAWRRSFDNSLTLGGGEYAMYWTAHPDNSTVRFGVDVSTDGWLGFGFSPNGGMVGSDMIMAWITEAGELHFSDRNAPALAAPQIDATNDYFGVRGLQYTVGGPDEQQPDTPDETADEPNNPIDEESDNAAARATLVPPSALMTLLLASSFLLAN